MCGGVASVQSRLQLLLLGIQERELADAAHRKALFSNGVARGGLFGSH